MQSRRPAARAGVTRPLARWLSLAALAGALHVLALPPLDQGWLAFAALVPLLAGLRRVAPDTASAALAGGAVFGLVSASGTIHWLPSALIVGNGLGPVAAWGVSALVVGWYTAAFALLPPAIRRLEGGWLPAALCAPIAWVAIETLRDAAAPALAWTVFGHTQHATLPLLQHAEIAGAPGLSFVLVLVNALLAEAIAPRWAGAAPSTRAAHAAWAAALVLVLLAAGGLRLDAEDHAREVAASGALPVAALQLAVPQTERWLPEQAWPRVDALLERTRAAADQGASLVVWPETSIEVHLDKAQGLEDRVARALSGPAGARVLAGAPREVEDSGGRHFYNSAVLLDARGVTVGLYDKVRLYPISEYVPGWLRFVPGATRAFASQLRWMPYTPGAATQAPIDAGVPIGVLICAEGVLEEPARRQVEAGARVLVHLANDAVIPGPAAAAQHFAIVRTRAVESRRPLVRASNLGVTAIVAPSGRVLDALPADEAGFALAPIVPRDDLTPHTRAGWLFAWLCVAVSLVGGLLPARLPKGR